MYDDCGRCLKHFRCVFAVTNNAGEEAGGFQKTKKTVCIYIYRDMYVGMHVFVIILIYVICQYAYIYIYIYSPNSFSCKGFSCCKRLLRTLAVGPPPTPTPRFDMSYDSHAAF